ncbi:MAG TPA: helix-turn-helix domain-containing protein [Rhizomicrobium sp.]|nr:helix-turn-helix domain-containing protein [Rhizomicrobium sp.]
MIAPAYEFRLQRFSTEEWPARTRLEAWREILSRKLIHSDVGELKENPFRVEAYMRALPGMRLGWGTFTPSRHERTREIVAQDNDDFFFLMNLEGGFLTRQARREIALAPGEAALLACSELGSYIRAETGRIVCLRFPSTAFKDVLPDAYDRVARVIPRQTESLKLLTNYAYALNGSQALVTPELRGLAVRHLYDLISLSLSASGDGAAEASERSLGPARLSAIKSYITANLANPNLSVIDVARKHALSPRQVQRLFEQTGQTFSEHVQRERLNRVYLMLTNPGEACRSIGEIVFACGFGDISHFNRAFRRRYGASPSDVRKFEAARAPR